MINVIATLEIKPGMRDEFLAIFKANMPAVLAEDGCISYIPCIDIPSGLDAQKEVRNNVVTVLEAWESPDHLRAHLSAPHMLEYGRKTQNMKLSADIKVMQSA